MVLERIKHNIRRLTWSDPNATSFFKLIHDVINIFMLLSTNFES